MATEIVSPSRPPREILVLRAAFDQQMVRLRTMCEANGLDAEYIATQVVTAALENPRLRECEPWSVYKATVDAVQLGLEPCGPKKQGDLLPYKTKVKGGAPGGGDLWIMKCEWQPRYGGLLTVVKRSGHVLRPYAEVVHEGDLFHYERGTNPRMVHQIGMEPGRYSRPITHIYAAAIVDGSWDFEVLTACRDCYRACGHCKGKGVIWKDRSPADCGACDGSGASSIALCDVEHIRSKSKAAFDGPWVTDWPEMAKKAALKRFCKRLPMDDRSARVIDLDNRQERESLEADSEPERPMPQRLTETRTAELRERLAAAGLKNEARQVSAQAEWTPPEGWDALAGSVTDLCAALDKPAAVAEHLKFAKSRLGEEEQLAALRSSVKTLSAELAAGPQPAAAIAERLPPDDAPEPSDSDVPGDLFKGKGGSREK